MSGRHNTAGGRIGVALATLGAFALVLTGCTSGGGNGDGGGGSGGSDEPIIVGTTDKVTTLDPAGSYDNGSLAVQTQVFPYLVNTDYN
ncbi:MAG: peptide ABC transporter substrate-binding protein, partial [Microbacterium sp.]